MMKNMSFYDPVQHGASNETKLAVNGSCSSTSVVPCGVVIVRETRITVLQERDGHCHDCKQADTSGESLKH